MCCSIRASSSTSINPEPEIRMSKKIDERYSPAESALLQRRNFLMQASGGLGSIALRSMFASDILRSGSGADRSEEGPLAPKKPHVKPRAKSVIWLFMEGGPSHLDTFDPKPKIQEL